jgi:hypothetical protein
MADLRTYFGAVMVVVLAATFVAILYSQAMQNGGYTDTGQFPLAGQTEGYMAQINNQSISMTNSLNATFGQTQNVDLTNSFFATASTAGQSMSIVWSSFMMVISMFNTLIMSPIAMSLGITPLVLGIGMAYISGLVALVILSVVLKWFI